MENPFKVTKLSPVLFKLFIQEDTFWRRPYKYYSEEDEKKAINSRKTENVYIKSEQKGLK